MDRSKRFARSSRTRRRQQSPRRAPSSTPTAFSGSSAAAQAPELHACPQHRQPAKDAEDDVAGSHEVLAALEKRDRLDAESGEGRESAEKPREDENARLRGEDAVVPGHA